jgi:hypothetical protein
MMVRPWLFKTLMVTLGASLLMNAVLIILKLV